MATEVDLGGLAEYTGDTKYGQCESLEMLVKTYLNDWGDYNVGAVVAELRDRINAVLGNDGMFLTSDDRFGGWTGTPYDDDDWDRIVAAIDCIDLMRIARGHRYYDDADGRASLSRPASSTPRIRFRVWLAVFAIAGAVLWVYLH